MAEVNGLNLLLREVTGECGETGVRDSQVMGAAIASYGRKHQKESIMRQDGARYSGESVAAESAG
jgi:hypothetical protein